MDPSRTVRELKVSGHTMALDPGLYCVFNAPGSSPPAAGSGLPGVRITLAPGTRAGTVDIAAFEPDGWLAPDGAALLRVTGGTAEVLVTVYQDHGSAAEAPRLQVICLSGEPAPEPTTPAQPEVVAHIYGRGDTGGQLDAWVGEPGSQRWIEGFAIAPRNAVPGADVEYQAVLGRGWLSPWSEGGQFCGSRGMSLPILGLRVRLRGPSAQTHRVQLSGRFVDGTEIGPVGGDEPCEAASFAALEAFRLCFVPAQPSAPAKAARVPRRR